MNNVGFDLQHLIVEHGLDQWVRILSQLGLRGLGEHDGTQGPDGVRRGESLCQTSCVLRDTVQRAFDLVDPLQGSSQPGLYLVAKNNIDLTAGSKGLRRRRQ